MATVTDSESATGDAPAAPELSDADRETIVRRIGRWVTDTRGDFAASGVRVWEIRGGNRSGGPVEVTYEDPQGEGIPVALLDAVRRYPAGAVEFRRVTGPTTVSIAHAFTRVARSDDDAGSG